MARNTLEKDPEYIMRRAQLWGEVFAAKDQGKVLKVQIVKPTRGGYTVELPWGLPGFLHCFDQDLSEGSETEARITVANYVSKEIKLKRVRDKKELENVLNRMKEAQKKRQVVPARIRSVVKGGILVDIMGMKAFVPSSQTPLGEKEAKALVGQELPVCLLRVSKKNSIASHKKALEQIEQDRKDPR